MLLLSFIDISGSDTQYGIVYSFQFSQPYCYRHIYIHKQ